MLLMAKSSTQMLKNHYANDKLHDLSAIYHFFNWNPRAWMLHIWANPWGQKNSIRAIIWQFLNSIIGSHITLTYNKMPTEKQVRKFIKAVSPLSTALDSLSWHGIFCTISVPYLSFASSSCWEWEFHKRYISLSNISVAQFLEK